jgi:pimeloyl-ACP methyl ester carboxylesterase
VSAHPRALLLHGLFAEQSNWWRVAPALEERGYEVVAPDLLGHGTAARSSPYTPRRWADDLVDRVRNRPFALAIGHSLGGLVLALAAERLAPERSVFLDPTWRMSAGQHRRFGKLWRQQLGWGRERWEQAFPTWAAGDFDARVRGLAAMDPDCIDGLVPGGGHDYVPTTPVGRALVIAADGSEFVPPVDARQLERAGFGLASLPEIGHAAFREDFDGFLHLLDGWLAS